MNQGKKGTSLSTTRLSALAKPFTINPSSSVHSSDHSNSDPFSSLLDSFKKTDLGSKDYYKVSTLTTQREEKTLFEQNPSLEFQKYGDFDGINWSHFEIVEPTYSPNVTGLGYGKKGVDFHESLFGKGNDGGGSVDDGSMLQQGKHSVDGLKNTSIAVSDGIFNKSTGTTGGKDIVSNCIGTIHATDESSSFLMSNYKLDPLKVSTADMSSAKNAPQIQTSQSSGDSDSDVDSPCWKGTMTICPTSSTISGSEKIHHVEKATEKQNSLNPRAPQFFPGIGYIKDDFVSSKSTAPIATKLLSGESIFMKTVMTESPLELNMGTVLQSSSNISGKEKASNMLNDRKWSSANLVLNSHSMSLGTKSSSKEDCSASKGKLATIVGVDDFVKGTKDPGSSGSISGMFPANGHSLMTSSTLSSSRVGVDTGLCKTLQDVLKSLINSPNPGCQMIVSAMHVLSDLLVQTCVDSVDSYNEHDRDTIHQIINNLNIISTKTCGQMIPTLVSTHADSSYCLDRSLEHPKGHGVTSIKTLAVPHEPYLWNDYMQKSSISKVFAQSGQNSFASSSDQCTEMGNEIAQFIRRSLGKSLEFEKQMPSEASLFRSLWLDCEAERCYKRYKTYRCLMEAGIDVNYTNVEEFWK
ncbi:hypothetical protein TanjilG_21640 [Lupinus angustifolius]|uniref:Uncharacterized protein n=1 Tax=Lupinus angustifolius TaxID=3871 RepID=A0A4P1QUP6_LUPAN|nr:PREDICTED: uncharacterized protein LOC109330012 [Lupinus angustifolius]OIV95250.1 hypothetical protein TanjilG_21640 [Lupinus angustifolius]